jgi:hypothetical protein
VQILLASRVEPPFSGKKASGSASIYSRKFDSNIGEKMIKGLARYRKTPKYKVYRKLYMRDYRKRQREELLRLRKLVKKGKGAK